MIKTKMTEHEDVQLLLQCDTLEALELVAEDPRYYLNLIMTYNLTESGEEIYLPYLLNIKTQHENGLLIIKFKLSPTSRWYEVGYASGTEEQTYAAFSKKVHELIKFPPPERNHLISEALEEIPAVKFTGLHLDNEDDEQVYCNYRNCGTAEEDSGTKEKEYIAELQDCRDLCAEENEYIAELQDCRDLCAEDRQEKYHTMLNVLTSSDAFVQKQLSLLPLATEPQRICVLHFLTDYVSHRR